MSIPNFDPVAQIEGQEYAARKASGLNSIQDTATRDKFFESFQSPTLPPPPAASPLLHAPPFPVLTSEHRLSSEHRLTSKHRLSSDPLPDSLTLILTVGLPRSGKSTWAKQQNLPIVSPDAIRLALHGQTFVGTAEPIVWATAHLMVASLFQAGHSLVILDACNVSRKRRAEWIDNRWQCVYAVFPTKKDVCIHRAKETGREDIIPIIERMDSEFEPVTQAINEPAQIQTKAKMEVLT